MQSSRLNKEIDQFAARIRVELMNKIGYFYQYATQLIYHTFTFQALLLPFMVSGTAGTAFIGSIDPLTNIGEIAKAHSLWFHVDAAYGGFFVLTEKGKVAMAGMCYFAGF